MLHDRDNQTERPNDTQYYGMDSSLLNNCRTTVQIQTIQFPIARRCPNPDCIPHSYTPSKPLLHFEVGIHGRPYCSLKVYKLDTRGPSVILQAAHRQTLNTQAARVRNPGFALKCFLLYNRVMLNVTCGYNHTTNNVGHASGSLVIQEDTAGI